MSPSLRLFHVSEEPSIAVFHPRPAPPGSSVSDRVVWAVDDAHLPNYLLPRACPRVTFRLSDKTSKHDRVRFFTSAAPHVVAISGDWFARAMSQRLFYSARKATIGSTRAARRAGTQQATSEMPKRATAVCQVLIDAGQSKHIPQTQER
jgi:hypothetical protein